MATQKSTTRSTRKTTGTKTTAKKSTATKKAAVKPKYDVTVNKYRRSYGAADFYVGSTRTMAEARELAKKKSCNGDSYVISYAGKDPYRGVNQAEKGTIYGTGKDKICKKGYTSKF